MQLLFKTIDNHLNFNILLAWQVGDWYSYMTHGTLGVWCWANGMGHGKKRTK